MNEEIKRLEAILLSDRFPATPIAEWSVNMFDDFCCIVHKIESLRRDKEDE